MSDEILQALSEIKHSIAMLSDQVSKQEARLGLLEGRKHTPAPTQKFEQPKEDLVELASVSSHRVETPKVEHKPEHKGFDEKNVGLYLSRIGMVGLILGFAFLLKYSFDNNLIGPMARIAMGYVSAIVIFFIGEYYRKKYPDWSRAFTGGSLVLLYFSTFAAQYFYDFFSLPITVLLFTIITAFGVIIAMLYDSPIIFLFAIVGGYLTPLLISSTPSEEGLLKLAYIAVLNIGILVATSIKKWRAFDLLSFLITIIFLALLKDEVSMRIAGIMTVIYYLIFFVSSYLLSIESESQQKKDNFLYIAKEMVVLYIVGHAAFLYLFIISIFEKDYKLETAIVGLVISAVYLIYTFASRHFQARKSHIYISTLSVSVACSIVALGFLNTATNDLKTGIVSLVVGLVYFASALLLKGQKDVDKLSKNLYMAMIVVSMAFSASAVAFIREATSDNVSGMLSVAIGLLYFATALIYRKEKENSQLYHFSIVAAVGFASTSIGLIFEANWSTILWSILSVGIVFASIEDRITRAVGVIVLHLAGISALSNYAASVSEVTAGESIIFLNPDFFSAIIPIVCAAICGYIYKNLVKDGKEDENESLSVYLYTITNFFFTLIMIAELWYMIEIEQIRNVSITIFLALYAIIAIAVGIIRKSKYSRVVGLVLFSVAIAKIILFDLAELELIFRVLAFISVGIILILASFLYQKYVEHE